MATVNGRETQDKRAEPEAQTEEWRATRVAEDPRARPPAKEEFTTLFDLEIKDVYTPADVADVDYQRDVALPGEYPVHPRSVHATMYRGRPWTIRQVAGFGQAGGTPTPDTTICWLRARTASTDFDLPTLLGL